MFQVQCQGAVHVLWGDEPLAREQTPQLERLLDEINAQGQPWAVLDMHDIPLLDSAGLELLLDAQDRMQARGGLMKLCAVNPLCRDILRATGVGLRFEVHDHARSAIGSFTR